MLITSWRVPVQIRTSADSVGSDSTYIFHLMIRDFIAIDFETANQEPSSVCSIGVVIRLADISGIEMTEALLYYLIVINVVTFLVYGIDKWKAKQGSWRISEATLLMLAVIGGSIGALLGMKVWRHKTQHKKFKYGLPLILIIQIILIGYLSK